MATFVDFKLYYNYKKTLGGIYNIDEIVYKKNNLKL